MAIAHVQSKSQYSGSTSEAIAFTSNITSGNLLIAFGSFFNGSTNMTVSDSRGNTWSSFSQYDNGAQAFGKIFYAISKDSGACTITLAITTGSDLGGSIYEISGINTTTPTDNGTTQGTNTTLATTSGSVSVTTQNNNCLLFSAIFEELAAENSVTKPSDFSNQTSALDHIHSTAIKLDAGTAGSKSADWSWNVGVVMGMLIVAFQPAGAAPATRRRIHVC